MNSRDDGPVKLIDSGDVDGHALTPHPAGNSVETNCLGRVADGSSAKHVAVHRKTAQSNGLVEPDIGYQARPCVNRSVGDAPKQAHAHAASCSTIAKPGDSTTSGRGYRSVAHASSSDSSIWLASSGNSNVQSPDGTARPPPRLRRVSTTP